MADEIKITEEAADAADVVPASAPTETVSTEIKDPARGSRPRFASIATVKLDPNNLKPTWPIVIASLEQMSDWAVFAFRLGTLTLIQNCVRQLAEPDANADLVVQLRTLTEALAHMPLEA